MHALLRSYIRLFQITSISGDVSKVSFVLPPAPERSETRDITAAENIIYIHNHNSSDAVN